MIKLFLLLSVVACGKPITEAKKDNTFATPLRIEVFEKNLLGLRMWQNFEYLPLEGKIKNKDLFWSGDSWRLINGSINYRWNSPRKEGRFAPPPTPQMLRTYSEDDFKRLAPSEKYDLLLGRYDYPLKSDVDRFLPDRPEGWEGLCHGWAGASLNHKEPKPKVFTNPDGLKIPFGASDIKALLTYYYAGVLVPEEKQLGIRCEALNLLDDDYCDEDVSPVDFHTILTNKIGLRGDSFIMDIDRYREVWNHPITGFETTILHQYKKGNGKVIHLRTTIFYVDVVEKGFWEVTNGTYSQMTSTQVIEYKLELDQLGNMIGGEWISRDRPDFIWIVDKVKSFTGYLSGLNLLTND